MIKKKIVYTIFIFFLVTIYLWFFLYNRANISLYPGLYITNFVIFSISIISLITSDRYNFSLNKIFFLFSIFFFGISPIIQFQNSTVFWGGTFISPDTYFRLNLIIIFILLIYLFLYSLIKPVRKNKNIGQENEYSVILMLILSILATSLILIVFRFDFDSLLFRSESSSIAIDNSSIELIFRTFIRPIPVITLLLFKLSSKKNTLVEVVLALLVLLTNFPTSNARFFIAAIYIPLLIMYLPVIKRKYLALPIILLIALVYIFPLLNQARVVNSIYDFNFSLNFDAFNTGHYDSYQMFARVYDLNYISYGKQLISVILFFVPRSLWPAKSIGSGSLIASEFNFVYDNISMNFFGEGYINFGFAGILIFVSILAYLTKKLDSKYWTSLKSNQFASIYLFMVGLLIFILRGDLLSSFSYTIGLILSIVFTNKILRIKFKVKV